MEDHTPASFVNRVGIVGSGPAAASSSHALLRLGAAQEIICVPAPGRLDTKGLADLVRMQTPVGATSLHSGTTDDLRGVCLVVLALEEGPDGDAPTESITSTMERLDEVASDAVVIVAGDHVDVATCTATRATDRPSSRVFGLGTCGETLELRRRVSQHYEVAEESVYALVVGHHGGAAVPVWSSAMIGGHQIVRGSVAGRRFDREAMWDAFVRGCDRAGGPVDDKKCRKVFERTVSTCVAAVLRDQRRVLPVTAPVDGPFDVRGVCLALPTIIGRKGTYGRILPDLSDDEVHAFRDAAEAVQAVAGAA